MRYTGNNAKLSAAGTALVGSRAVSAYLSEIGNYELAALTTQIGNGVALVSGILYVKGESENKKLRTYYAH